MGVLLYQLLTGERPFEGGLSAIMHKALHTEPPAPSEISVTAPPAFDAAVKKAMAKRPDARFPSAAAFAQALLAAAAGPAASPDAEDATFVAPRKAAAPTPEPGVRIPIATPRKGRLLPIVAGALVLVLAVGGGTVFLLRSPQQAPQAPAPPNPVAPNMTPAKPTGIHEPQAPVQPNPIAPEPVVPREAVPEISALPPAKEAGAEPAPKRAADPAMIRDQLVQIVVAQRCALINGTVRDNGEAVLTGIAGPGAQGDFRQTAANRAVPGTIQWRVASADAMFCPAIEVLQSIAPALGAGGPRLTLGLADGRTALHDGERIRPRLGMPNFAGYVRVDYIAHDGNVQHLYPQIADTNGTVADPVRALAPAERLSLGDPPPSQPAWEAGEPYGTDMIIAIASSEPLFERPRPANVEPSADYIRDLETTVAALRGGGARMIGSAVLVEALPK